MQLQQKASAIEESSIEQLYHCFPVEQRVPFSAFQLLPKEVIVYALKQKYPLKSLFMQKRENYVPIKQNGIEFFNMDNLSKFRSSDIKNVISYLKSNSYQFGFKLFNWDGNNDVRCRLYCEKGGRNREFKSSNKTRCPFIIYITKKGSNEFYISNKSILFHKHSEYEPTGYRSILQSEELKLKIRKLGNVMTPTQIQEIIPLISNEDVLSTFDISRIIYKKEIKEFAPESVELQSFVQEQGGIVQTYDIKVENKIKRIAVLTIMNYELSNLNEFSNIIQIDGTQLPTHNLRWELTPITLLDNEGNIRSGGILFSAIMDKKIIKWLIKCLQSLKEFHCEIIITDEDSAYIPALQELEEEGIKLTHLLCAEHKKKNFYKKLMELGLNKRLRKNLKAMFHQICYSYDPKIVDKLIEQMKNLKNDGLNNYLDNNIIPLLHKFAKSKIKCFTKGINTTSNAESRNRMIKLRLNKSTNNLKSIREKIIECDLFAMETNRQRYYRRRINSSFPIKVCHKVEKEIMKSIEKSKHYKITKVNESQYLCSMLNSKEDSFLITNLNCSCNKLRIYGIPCVHLISLYNYLHIPDQLFSRVHKFWIQNKRNYQLNEEMHNMKMDEEESEYESSEYEPSEDLFNEEEEYLPLKVPNVKRYLELLHLGKSIASLASRSNDVYLQTREQMNAIHDKILGIEGGNEIEKIIDNDSIEDASGVPRCRTKNRNRVLPNGNENQLSCEICGLIHDTQSCIGYKEWTALLDSDDQGNGRKCSVCRKTGHYKNNCPFRQKILEYYRNKALTPDH